MAAAADAAFAAGHDFGPLHGIPVSIKDNLTMAGTETFAGSARALPDRFPREAAMVGRLKRGLAVIVGKTHTPEFAMCGYAINAHWGTPRNPWDGAVHRVPGGSSGGAAISLLEGSAHIAFGTDSGGSVRIPPSFLGLVGLKPGYGRWPIEGIVPPGVGRDSVGPMTRTVADLAHAWPALDGPGARAIPRIALRDLTLGVPGAFFWDGCEPGIAEGVQAALDEARAAGARLVDFDFPEAAAADAVAGDGPPLDGAETFAAVQAHMPSWLDRLDPVVSPTWITARTLRAVNYLRRVRRLDALADVANARLGAVDAVVAPTVTLAPPPLDALATPARRLAHHSRTSHNTAVANYLHLAALTLPVARCAAGMPVGLQLLAPRGREVRLIAAGLALEGVLGTGRARLGQPPMLRASGEGAYDGGANGAGDAP